MNLRLDADRALAQVLEPSPRPEPTRVEVSRPLPRPTAASAALAQRRHAHDPSAALRRHHATSTTLPRTQGDQKDLRVGLDQALPVLSEDFDLFAGHDGYVSRSDLDLLALWNDPGIPADLRQAARVLLEEKFGPPTGGLGP